MVCPWYLRICFSRAAWCFSSGFNVLFSLPRRGSGVWIKRTFAARYIIMFILRVKQFSIVWFINEQVTKYTLNYSVHIIQNIRSFSVLILSSQYQYAPADLTCIQNPKPSKHCVFILNNGTMVKFVGTNQLDLLSSNLLSSDNQSLNYTTWITIDCKTVRIFACSSARELSKRRFGTRLKTENETGERR